MPLRRALLLVFAALSLFGCASYERPLPPDYRGPVAEIWDEGDYDSNDRTRGHLFYLSAIDAKDVESSLVLTRRATHGKGFQVVVQLAVHKVPAKSLRLQLVGTHVTGAPIHEIVARSAGTFQSVEGVVVVDMQSDTAYVVTGRLDKTGSTVWLANKLTRERVSDIVQAK